MKFSVTLDKESILEIVKEDFSRRFGTGFRIIDCNWSSYPSDKLEVDIETRQLLEQVSEQKEKE